jgi:hypothetical protein
MKEDQQEKKTEQDDKAKPAAPKPLGKIFGRRGHEKTKGGAK